MYQNRMENETGCKSFAEDRRYRNRGGIIMKEQIKSIQTTIQENKVAIANDTLKVNNLKVVQHNDQEK